MKSEAMKKNLLFTFLFLSCSFSKAQVKQVLKAEQAILDAFCKQDTQFIKNSVDDAFILVHADGAIDGKKEFIRSYSSFTPDNKLSIHTSLEKSIDKGDIMIIVGRVESSWKEGKDDLASINRYTDTYKKHGDNWLLVSSFTNDIGEDFFRLKDTTGVWAAIRHQYEVLDRSVEDKNLCVHLALKTEDFSTLDDKGNFASASFMRNRSKNLFNAMIDSIETNNTVEKIEIAGDTAKATVLQIFKRRQKAPGKIRYFETSARQRESWMLTREGWKLVFVDKVVPLTRVVDGIKTDPTKPVNWNDPVFQK